jgi:hypothetical protein
LEMHRFAEVVEIEVDGRTAREDADLDHGR